MHTRQSGVAHVNVFFFLIVLVLFLGSTGFAWVTLNKNNQLLEERANLRTAATAQAGKDLLEKHYLEDMVEVVKIPGTYEGQERFKADYLGNKLEGVIDPAAMKQKLDQFADAVEVPRMNSLDALLGQVSGKIDALKQQVADAKTAQARIATEKSAVDASFASAGSTHSSEVTNLTNSLNQASDDFRTQLQDKENLLNATRQNLRDKNSELAKAQEDNAAEIRAKDQEIGQLRGHNTALVNKMAMHDTPDVPDGKVIAAAAGLDSAWISLGTKDMLRPGTIFRIQNPNTSRVKAYGQVSRVQKDRAEIQLSGIVDPIGDQVSKGDLLFNNIYSPNVRRNIYLMGRFSYPYNQPELAALLKDLGNSISPKMVPGVDLVILGDAIINEDGDGFISVEDTNEYKTALNLGVEFAPLHKIRDLIKL